MHVFQVEPPESEYRLKQHSLTNVLFRDTSEGKRAGSLRPPTQAFYFFRPSGSIVTPSSGKTGGFGFTTFRPLGSIVTPSFCQARGRRWTSAFHSRSPNPATETAGRRTEWAGCPWAGTAAKASRTTISVATTPIRRE